MSAPDQVVVEATMPATAYRQLLDARAAERTLFDKVMSLPRAAGEWLMRTARALHLDALAARGGQVAGWLLERLRWGASVLRDFGLAKLALFFTITSEGRALAAGVISVAYRVVTAPVRALGWLFRQLMRPFGGGGQRVVAAVYRPFEAAERWLYARGTDVREFLAKHHNHELLRWARLALSVATIWRLAVMFVPAPIRWIFYLGSLFINLFTDDAPDHPDEAAAIERARTTLAGKATGLIKDTAGKVGDAAERVEAAAEAVEQQIEGAQRTVLKVVVGQEKDDAGASDMYAVVAESTEGQDADVYVFHKGHGTAVVDSDVLTWPRVSRGDIPAVARKELDDEVSKAKSANGTNRAARRAQKKDDKGSGGS